MSDRDPFMDHALSAVELELRLDDARGRIAELEAEVQRRGEIVQDERRLHRREGDRATMLQRKLDEAERRNAELMATLGDARDLCINYADERNEERAWRIAARRMAGEQWERALELEAERDALLRTKAGALTLRQLCDGLQVAGLRPHFSLAPAEVADIEEQVGPLAELRAERDAAIAALGAEGALRGGLEAERDRLRSLAESLNLRLRSMPDGGRAASDLEAVARILSRVEQGCPARLPCDLAGLVVDRLETAERERDDLRRQLQALAADRDRLLAWQSEALADESSCDAQLDSVRCERDEARRTLATALGADPGRGLGDLAGEVERSMGPGRVHPPMRSMDGESNGPALEWLGEIARAAHAQKRGMVEIRSRENSDDHFTVLWVRNRPRAAILSLRDDSNFTVTLRAEWAGRCEDVDDCAPASAPEREE